MIAGLRVNEIESLGPAPFACTLLADLGADLIIAFYFPGEETSLVFE